MSARVCPGCGQGMVVGRLGPVELDLCLPCGAVWFDEGELGQVVQAGAVVLRRLHDRLRPATGPTTTRVTDTHLGERGRCPLCQVPLGRITSPSLPDVALQTCAFCKGTWLGTDALARIADHLAPASPAASPRPAPGATSAPPRSPPVSHAPVPAVPPPTGSAASRPARPSTSPQPVPPPKTAPHPVKGMPVARPQSPARSASAKIGLDDCPGCGERNAPGAPVCWACGKVLKGTVTGTCPRCEGTMRRIESRDAHVDACDGCGGVWLQEGMLDLLEYQADELQENLLTRIGRNRTGKIHKLNPGMLCPHCSLVLFRANLMLSAEVVDHCPGCAGTFLDEGLLDTLLRTSRIRVKSSRR